MSVYRGDPSRIGRPIWTVLPPGTPRVGMDHSAKPVLGMLLESPVESPVIMSMTEEKQEAASRRRGGA